MPAKKQRELLQLKNVNNHLTVYVMSVIVIVCCAYIHFVLLKNINKQVICAPVTNYF